MDWIPIVWVVVGVVLILSEVIVTGVVAVFFGVAAIITGLAIVAGLPAQGPASFVLFSALSVGLLMILRRRFAVWLRGNVVDGGDSDGVEADFIGKDARVLDGFGADDHGRGRVDYRGAAWSAKCAATLAPGALVVITGRDNLTLLVEPQED